MFDSRFKKPALSSLAIYAVFSAYILFNTLDFVMDITDTKQFLVFDDESVIGLSVLLFLGCIPLFLVWTYRVSKNLQYLNVEDLKLKPRWAVGWFFIPLANTFLPHDVFLQIWRGSSVSEEQAEQSDWLVRLWWWSFILSGALSSLSLKALTQSSTNNLYNAVTAARMAEVVATFSAILAIVLVVSINRLQSARYAHVS